tara:strand:+ start:621 stop:827 length:207 start_codon:yes stop_codon:yes gene_type:complete
LVKNIKNRAMEKIQKTKSEQAAHTIMGDCHKRVKLNLSLDELEAMLMKSYEAGYENAKEESFFHGYYR